MAAPAGEKGGRNYGEEVLGGQDLTGTCRGDGAGVDMDVNGDATGLMRV